MYLVLLRCVFFIINDQTLFLCACKLGFVTRNRAPTIKFGGGPKVISIKVVHLVGGTLRGGFHLIYLEVSITFEKNRERREY